jgi:hypothetical protein
VKVPWRAWKRPALRAACTGPATQWGQTGRYRPDAQAARRRSAAGTRFHPGAPAPAARPPDGAARHRRQDQGRRGRPACLYGLTRLSILIPAIACRREVPKDCREVQRRRAVARLGRVWDGPLRVPRLWARLPLRHDDERHRRVAGQADRDRPDHAVVAGGDELPTMMARVSSGWASPMAVAAAISSSTTMPWRRSNSQAAPLARSCPAAWVQSSCSISSKFFSISAMAPCDSMSRLDR